ncbi:MAG: MGMT family protein [Clostridia bacterium]|nr:MGMT family protein [Clostridia bacterium]
MSDFYMKVYSVVCCIPKGKVATYGQIAKMLGSSTYSRSVGNALHHNPDMEKIPCHRVVKANGALADNYAFGGIEGQKSRLVNEGVEVTGNKVDLKKYLW